MADGEGREYYSEVLCDDCFIDCIWPIVRKAYYENDPAGFMRRLQVSYSVLAQRYR